MADQKFELPFYKRFLQQKGGVANIAMAGFTVVLSIRLMQQRDEFKANQVRLEAQFAAEKRELQDQIDGLKNKSRGWWGGSGEPAKKKEASGGGSRWGKGGGAPKDKDAGKVLI